MPYQGQTTAAPEISQLRAEVLALLRVDDLPVQEVWWAANSLFPDVPLSSRLALAERLVRTLVEEGAADLYRSPGPASPLTADTVDAPDLEAVLRSWSTWITSEEAVLLRRRAA